MFDRSRMIIVCAISYLAWSEPALAQDQAAYRAEDIEKHFASSDNLGSTRAICIGTESECSRGASTAERPPKSFDLLINFEFNSDFLTRGARLNLDEFAKALRSVRLRSASFVVEGHTDAKGSDKFNIDLSARRAEAVVRYLEDRGVAADRLEPRAFGKSRPRTENPSDPENRRVEARMRG